MAVRIITGDCRDTLRLLPDQSVHCVVTSPPYFGLRDYGVAGQIGLEPTPEDFVAEMVDVFREVRRVLRNDGTLWLNLGDSYAGSLGAQSRGNTTGEPKSTITGASMLSARQIIAHPKGKTHTGSLKNTPGLKPKDLIGIPWRVAFALQTDGWYLRSDIIWHKPNPMPESVTDRPTSAHEHIFLLSKSERYFYDADAIAEEGSNTSHGGAPTDAGPKTQGIRRDGGVLGIAATRKRGVPPRHSQYASSDQSGLDDVQRGRRNKRNVWTVATRPFREAHFATFPPDLIEPCILAGCPAVGTVLDPFGGAGTTGLVADRCGRDAILMELNPEYAAMTERRISKDAGIFAAVQSSTPIPVQEVEWR